MKKFSIIIIAALCFLGLLLGTAAGYAFYRLRLKPEDAAVNMGVSSPEPSALSELTRSANGGIKADGGAVENTLNGVAAAEFTPVDTNVSDDGARGYVLSVFEGYIAVFSAPGPETRLLEVTRTPASALSPDERNRLTTGIEITGDEQLARILQDYGS